MKTSERDFTNMLTQLANDGMTTERLKASGETYQEFSRVAADWVSEVALKRYRSVISANASASYDEYLDDAVWKIIIERLDCILSRPETERIKYVMAAISNMVVDKGREYRRTYYVSRCVGNEKEYEKRFAAYDEIALERLAGDTPTVDGEMISKENHQYINERVVEALGYLPELSRFDAVSLIGTKIINVKNSVLSTALDEIGLLATSQWVFDEFIRQCEADISAAYFRVEFKHEGIPQYKSKKDLSALISKHSHSAECALARKMGIERGSRVRRRDEKGRAGEIQQRQGRRRQAVKSREQNPTVATKPGKRRGTHTVSVNADRPDGVV